MNRTLAYAAAGLLLGATALAPGGIPSTHAASPGVKSPTINSTQLHYADALLWPLQLGSQKSKMGKSNASGNGSSTILWQNANVPGGSFAILSGQGKNLNFILHARFLQPNTSYSAAITLSSCADSSVAAIAGNGNPNVPPPLGKDVIGKATSQADGSLTLTGTLGIKALPVSFVLASSAFPTESRGPNTSGNGNNVLAIRLVPTSKLTNTGSEVNGRLGDFGYCGDIMTVQAVIPLKSMNGSKVQGIAMVSTGVAIWWQSSNAIFGRSSSSSASGGSSNGSGASTGNSYAIKPHTNTSNATQVVVFAHGQTPNAVQEEQLVQGTCSNKHVGRVEYPLTHIETNSSGEGVAGTLLNTTVNILKFPSVVSGGTSSSGSGSSSKSGSSSSSKSTSKPPSSEQLSLDVQGTNFKAMACGDLPYNGGISSSSNKGPNGRNGGFGQAKKGGGSGSK